MEPHPNHIQYAAFPESSPAVLSPAPKRPKRSRTAALASPELAKLPCTASTQAGLEGSGIKIRLRWTDIYSGQGKEELKEYKETVAGRVLGSGYQKQRAEDFLGLKLMRHIAALAALAPPVRPRPLQRLSVHSKLLVFDLDNTLVYSTPAATGCPHQLSVQLSTGKAITAGLHIRPWARECLQLASQLFEVAVFTASFRCYSDQVISLLDPANSLIQHRLFREDCLRLEGKVLVKDLRLIENFALKDIAIVENSVASFSLQLSNGVPVSTWSGETEDCQLRELMLYLGPLARCEDVRVLNREVFGTYYASLGEELST